MAVTGLDAACAAIGLDGSARGPLARAHRWLLSRTGPQRPLATPPAGSGLAPVMGDPGLPVLGHSLETLRLGVAYGMRRYERYGPVSWGRIFGFTMVAASGPEATRIVLTNRDKAYSQQGWHTLIGPFFHRGLMLLDFEEHHFHRRLMQEAFTAQRLAGYLDQVSDVVEASLKDWSPRSRFLAYPAFKQLTLDVATRVFMGAPPGTRGERELITAFVDTVRAGTSIVRFNVPGGRWAAGLRGRKVLEDYFRANLAAKRAGDSGDLFAALCHARTDDGHEFSDDDVVNHMVFLMMAAHDTSTITATAVAYYLGRHPEWQQRVREESLALGDGPLGVAEIERLHSLDLVIKEALRLVAPVPSVARRTVRDTELLGHFVPAGVLVGVSPWVNHLLPDYWTDPQRFDPDRFGQARREDRGHRYAWLPFGGGVHKCIGMHFGTLEVKMLLHRMVREFTWSVPAGYRVHWDTTALPVPADGLPIRLARR